VRCGGGGPLRSPGALLDRSLNRAVRPCWPFEPFRQGLRLRLWSAGFFLLSERRISSHPIANSPPLWPIEVLSPARSCHERPEHRPHRAPGLRASRSRVSFRIVGQCWSPFRSRPVEYQAATLAPCSMRSRGLLSAAFLSGIIDSGLANPAPPPGSNRERPDQCARYRFLELG